MSEVRLIDANKLIKDLICDIEGVPIHGSRKITYVEVRSAIRNTPTIDPESLRPKGEWEQVEHICGSKYARCTNCNNEFSITGEWTFEDYLFYMHYCPSCGAKMIRGDE